MRKKTLFAVIAVALCAIVAAGGLLASNMGFKLNYALNAPGPGSATGKNTLALPYFRQTGLDDAQKLMVDINDGNPISATAKILNVQKFNEANDTLLIYNGRRGSAVTVPFALTAGEGYFVAMVSNQNYIVVGSHDPAQAIALDAPGGGSATGKNLIAPPYNITATNALQLMQDIGGGPIGPTSPILNVQKFNKANDTLLIYNGRRGSAVTVPFVLAPGEAYFAAMTAPVAYIASHY